MLIAPLPNIGIFYFLGFTVFVSAIIEEFLVQVSSGDKDQRTKEALGTMGASVFR